MSGCGGRLAFRQKHQKNLTDFGRGVETKGQLPPPLVLQAIELNLNLPQRLLRRDGTKPINFSLSCAHPIHNSFFSCHSIQSVRL